MIPSGLPIRCRAFLLSDTFSQKLIGCITALQSSFWLGILDASDYKEITLAKYQNWDRYKKTDHNSSGLFAWEENALREFFPADGRILVGASGGGREALSLAKRGYEVSCFECVPELLEYSKELFAACGADIQAAYAPPSEVPKEFIKPHSDTGEHNGFAAAVLGWGAYMHMPGRANRIRFLRELGSCLEPEAPLLLSFFARKRGPLFYRVVRSGARFLRTLRRDSTPVELGDMLQGTFDHHFTDEEIRQEMAEAGFRCVQILEESFPHAVGIWQG